MGMYTEFHLDAVLKDDCPEEAKQWLTNLIDEYLDEFDPATRPRHVFWHDYRASFLGSGFDSTWPEFEFPRLRIHCEVKNHDDVLEKFLDWLAPYVKTATGTFQYEEWDAAAQVNFTEVDGESRFVLAGKIYEDDVPEYREVVAKFGDLDACLRREN